MLYRYGGDSFHALSLSFGEARAKDNISEVCTQLNTKCHVTMKNLIQEDVASPHSIEGLNVQELISIIDPDIWKAICLLTKPSKRSASTTSAKRDIRRLFCLCAILSIASALSSYTH